MSDPTADDDLAATRARARLTTQDLLELAEEVDRLKAQLAEWTALLHVVPEGAEGPEHVVRWIVAQGEELRRAADLMVRLTALAEAAKALAAAEHWQILPCGDGREMVASGYDGEECDHSALLTVARALLALGPAWDWRSK